MNNERLKEIKDNIDYGMTGAKLQALKHAEIVYNEEKELYNEVIKLKSRIEKAINKIQYIRDIGFDYDGFNNTKDLKKLIDELVDIAGQSIDILNGRSDE